MQIVRVQEDNPQMGDLESESDAKSSVPSKPSAWPLLSPFMKFLNDISKCDLELELSQQNSLEVGDKITGNKERRSSSLIKTLLQFMTAHDYQKLTRLSTQFYSKHSSLDLFKKRGVVL